MLIHAIDALTAPSRRLATAAILSFAIVLGLATSAPGQVGNSFGPSLDTEQMLAAELTRSAISVLQNEGNGQPREDQYIRAEILLGLALELAPGDPQLWELRRELADRMGDTAARSEALQRYLELSPSDDAAQLQRILLSVENRDTVDKRLSVIQRILQSEAAESLSDPLKSRLASYAAAAAREIGDQNQFTQNLTQAIDWDPTNAQAARLMVEFAQERNASSRILAGATIKQIRADPLLAQARLRLAGALLGEAAFVSAARQFSAASQLAGGPLAPQAYRDWLHSLAASGQIEDAISLVDQLETVIAQGAEQANAAQASQSPSTPTGSSQNQGNPNDGNPLAQDQPAGSTNGDQANNADEGSSEGANAGNETANNNPSGDTELPIDLQIKRILILDAIGRNTRVNDLYQQIGQRLTADMERGEPTAGLDFATLQALLGRDLDQATTLLDRGPDTTRAEAVRGLVALAQGNRDRAQQLLEPLVGQEPLAGLGMAELSAVDAEGRASAMTRVAHAAPTSLAGMIAAMRSANGNQAVQPTPTGRALLSMMQRSPSRLWDLDIDTRPWIEMQMEAQPGRFGFLEPIPVRITIQNVTQMPLSLGPGRTVPSRLFVSVAPSIRGSVLGQLPPIVADAARKLTLGPNESVTETIRLDRSVFGLFLSQRPFTSLRFNMSGVLDPRATGRGAVEPGPLGSRETLRALQAWSLPPTNENIEAWLNSLGSGDDIEQLQALAWLVALNPNNPDSPVDAAMANRVGERIAQAYADYGPTRQAWIIKRAMVPANPGSILAPVYEAASSSEQPLVRIAYLADHVSDPDAPVLTDAINNAGDTRVRRFALALQAGLRAQNDAQAQQSPPANRGAVGSNPGSNRGGNNSTTPGLGGSLNGIQK